MKAVNCGLLLCVLAFGLWAQQDHEFHEWMEDTDKASAVLRKMDPKIGDQAVRAAERIGGVYEEMIQFWRQKNAADAVKMSETGKAASVQLAAAAKAGDAEKAASAFKELSGTCMGCHKVYRERTPEGKFRFKTPADAPK